MRIDLLTSTTAEGDAVGPPRVSLAALVLLFLCVIVTAAPMQAFAKQAKQLRFFNSGHSLNDDPFPGYLAAIAKSKGYAVDWEQQLVVGSPIGWRVYADNPDKSQFAGYRIGKNRHDRQGMDVIKELRRKDAYDALIIAEGHNTVAVLRWHQTHRFLRHFHDRLVEGNPSGTTYLYEPWESMRDKLTPAPWMALERDASKIWSCVTDRINKSLDLVGRKDRVANLPIGAAVVELVDRATNGTVAGVTGKSLSDTMNRIFLDDVHLTPMGLYYSALVSFAGITGEDVKGVWQPSNITKQQATSLQEVATAFHEYRRTTYQQPDLAGCRRLMTDSFCKRWNDYVPSKWVGPVNDCESFFSHQSYEPANFESYNPLHFDPSEREDYWLPAP